MDRRRKRTASNTLLKTELISAIDCSGILGFFSLLYILLLGIYLTFRRYPDAQIEDKYIINGYVMIISSVFLFLTILFYACSGEAKKLFGKTLVSFCVCLILTFFILIYSTFSLEAVKEDATLCHTFGNYNIIIQSS